MRKTTKPKAPARPFTQADIKPTMRAFRQKAHPFDWLFPSAVDATGIMFANYGHISWANMYASWEVTSDLVKWYPCQLPAV